MSDCSVCRDVDKKGFVDPIRTLTLAQLKQEQTDRSRTPTGKDVHVHRLYLDPHSKARLANTQVYYTTLLITSAKEVMFSVASVCLSVCKTTEKVLNRF